MSDKKMEKKPSRTSILKPRKSINQSDLNDSNSEVVPARDARRVSFASSNFVKPFAADPEKNTIWDNTYEEEVNHTDSTSETKGFLDTHSVNALTFNNGNEEAGPFFIGAQNTSVRSLSINTTNIDECNKENYVPVILKNPFVAEGSIHVDESIFKTEMNTSKIQFTNLDSIQTQNQENSMELTCMPSILPNNNISVENTTQDMELTDISLKLTDFPPTSNLFYTQTVKRFESDLNKENIVDLKYIPIPDNNLTNVLPTTSNTQKVPAFFQNSELFRKNKSQELEIKIVDQTNTVACPDMQLTCTHSKEDNNIPEKDFNNSEVSMEITSDIVVDESKNASMKNVENSGASMQLTQIVSTNNNGNILEKPLGHREVNDIKKDMDTSAMNKSSVYASGNYKKSSENTTKNNTDTSMKFTCVFPPIGQIISSNINDTKTDVDNNMQITCVDPDTNQIIKKFADVVNEKGSESIDSTNIDTSMQFTCVFPNSGQIISNNINNTNTDIDNSMQMTCIHPDTTQIIKNFADVGNEKGSESISSKNIDTSMQFTCVFPNPDQIISNKINDTKTDMDNHMQMTCIHPDTSQIIQNFADMANEKGSESISSKIIDTSMQFTCVFPNPDQIISNKIKDTKTDMDNNMQMTCIHPDTTQIIKKFADVGNEKGSESISSKNIDTSMRFTCVFPPSGQVISNINGTDMQMTCANPDTSKINENFTDMGNEGNTSKNLDTSMQFPPTDQIISNNIHDIRQASMKLEEIVPNNVYHNNRDIDNSIQISCQFPESSKSVKTSSNKNIITKTSEENINKSVGTSMQLTCVFPQPEEAILANEKSYSGTVNCENSNIQLTNEIVCKDAVNTDTSMVSKRDINGTLCDMTIDKTAGVHATVCDMSIDETHNLEYVAATYVVPNDGTNQKIIDNLGKNLCNMSIDETRNLEGMALTYVVPKDSTNQKIIDNPIENECNMSIDKTHNLEGIAVTYVMSNDGTDQKIIDNPSKNVTTENGTIISDRVGNIKSDEQVKDEAYFVPIKKPKFAETLQYIASTGQEHTEVDEYKRKTQETSLGYGTSKTQIKKSCEEANIRSEHKVFSTENDEDSKTRLKETKESFAGYEIQEDPMVSKILTRSRAQFLKFREEFNSAKQKQDNTTTNLAEIKDSPVLIRSNEEDIDKTSVEMPTYVQSKDLQLCEDFHIKKRVELEYNVAEHKTSAGIFKSPVPTCDDPLVSSQVLTRSKHALLQPSEDYNLKTSKINNKMNNLEEDTELKVSTSGIVTRSRNKVLNSNDDLKPKYHEDHDHDNANISKDSSCIQYLRGDHVSLSDNNSMDESFKTNVARLTSSTDKQFPLIVESRLKTTDKSEINAGHLLIPRIHEKFGPNDTTLTAYDSSLLKETSVTSNDDQNSQEAKSTNSQLTNNLLDRASSAGKPAFSFDIGRSSTLVNRIVISDDDEIVDTCNLKKEKIMRLNSDVLRMDDASSSFALMLSNSPHQEYPGKKIYSTRTRPLLGLKRDDSTTEEYSKYEKNPVLTSEETKESIANIEVEPTTNLSNTPRNKSMLLCDTSPVIVDMTIDDEYIQETDKSKIDSLKTRLSNSFNQHPSEYNIALVKLLDEYQQCLDLPKVVIPEIDNDLIKKLDSARKKTEQLIKNLTFYKRDVVDLEELDKLEKFGSSSTSRFSEEMLSAGCVSSNTGEDTGWGDITVSKSLEDKIKEAASRSEKYWEYAKADDEFYYFYTYDRVVPFKVKVHPDSGIVDKIYTYTNLIENPEPLFCYNSKFLLEKLKNENLLLALGGKFDLLTLLDYVSICMEEIIYFSTEFNKLKVEYGPTHKFRMNSDSSVCVEVIHINYVIWWVITIQLSIHNLGSIDHITAKQIYEEMDEKQIQSLGKNFSGSLQLRNFIINLDQHVEKVGKRVLAYRQNELLT